MDRPDTPAARWTSCFTAAFSGGGLTKPQMVDVLRCYANPQEWQSRRSETIRTLIEAQTPDGSQTPRPPRFAQLTNQQVAALLDAYRAGESTYQLAERFGVHRQTVAATLRRAGVATRGLERVELTYEQRAEAHRLCDEGVSYHQIGIALGVSERAVSRTLRQR